MKHFIRVLQLVVMLVAATLGAGLLGLLTASAFIFGGFCYLLCAAVIHKYRLASPERQAQLERDWWMSDKELPAPLGEIDWQEFEDAVQLRLEVKQDPWAPIDVDDMIYRAERDMKYVFPEESGAPWPPIETEDKDGNVVATRPYAAWNCINCGKNVVNTDHRCPHCKECFRGGGPYSQEVFDGPDGPFLETIYTDPSTGEKTIVSSHKVDDYETVQVAQGGTEYIIPTRVSTSRHDWSGGTDLSSNVVGLFQIPPHQLGPGKPEDFHISTPPRHQRLAASLALAVREHQITHEQALEAMQRLAQSQLYD